MKITEFVDVFGYDLLNAIRAVARITPAPELKEFFEGFISTIETGGDLKDFLQSKSEEYMLSYKLERQKYTETISLYSDIYTGVLIAAPLFFIVALSLVNILGGRVGNMNVELLIALGVYLAIPLLNVAFIIFLEISQPDS
jgi:flagellar protein FlaJ